MIIQNWKRTKMIWRYLHCKKRDKRCRNINHWNKLFIIQGCVTKDGPDPNKPCVFPFIDRGIPHSKCTYGASDLQPWCPTEVDQNGYYIDEKWGNCEKNCETGNTSFVSLMSDNYSIQYKLNLVFIGFRLLDFNIWGEKPIWKIAVSTKTENVKHVSCKISAPPLFGRSEGDAGQRRRSALLPAPPDFWPLLHPWGRQWDI